MNHKIKHGLQLAIGILTLTGCAGYDRILFVTKTNVGLDIDDKPPTAEITIARRELAIAPTFQDAPGEDKTLPLLASFSLKGNFLNPEISSRFAGGNAALILAQGPERRADIQSESSICLSKEPDTRSWWKRKWHSIFGQGSKENTRAFYFATDTSFGLKVAWDGTTGPYPTTLRLGYNRKELAFPPVFATPGCSDTPTPSKDSDYDGPWTVTIPSFVASLDNSSTINDVWKWSKSEEQSKDRVQVTEGMPPQYEERTENGVTHIQFFATGKAASEFVKRADVNAAMNRSMYPQARQIR